MRSWRHLLLVVSLLLGQLLAGAHAVEHAASKEDGLPTHVCQLCLTAHDLGAALPGGQPAACCLAAVAAGIAGRPGPDCLPAAAGLPARPTGA
jgi:hypothetical protein